MKCMKNHKSDGFSLSTKYSQLSKDERLFQTAKFPFLSLPVFNPVSGQPSESVYVFPGCILIPERFGTFVMCHVNRLNLCE